MFFNQESIMHLYAQISQCPKHQMSQLTAHLYDFLNAQNAYFGKKITIPLKKSKGAISTTATGKIQSVVFSGVKKLGVLPVNYVTVTLLMVNGALNAYNIPAHKLPKLTKDFDYPDFLSLLK